MLARHGLSDDEDAFAEADLDRIGSMLRHVDELEHRASHPETVELAVWFAGMQHLPAQVTDDVRRLLDVLKDHDPAAGDGDGQVLSDADLAILSAPADAYGAYIKGLRVDDDTRLDEVDALLERDSIYRTPEMRAGREARAQLNLARERRALRTTVNSAKSRHDREPIR